MQLSNNFPLHELTKSATASRLEIDNSLVPGRGNDSIIIEKLRELCKNILQPVRENFSIPFIPNSGYRSFELERALCRPAIDRYLSLSSDNTVEGYLTKKQHPRGEAADMELPGVDNLLLARWIERHLEFDQLILEFYSPRDPNAGWVHASYVSPAQNRHEILTIGATGARGGLPDFEGA
jgi:hypothetical protein